MKDLVGAAYWLLAGALVVPALYFTFFYPVPPYLGPSGEEVICGTISGQFIVTAVIFWGIMLLGLVLWIATRRLTDAGRAV